MSEDEIAEERQRLARTAMDLMERRGEEISRAQLATELGIARTRVEQIFPDMDDLRDAVTAEWFAPKLTLMDEVMASDLPPRRKMYEFFARRFVLMQDEFRADPATFRLYVEMGEDYFEHSQSYVDLADHYLCELIAEAQADGYFPDLEINDALSLINQAVACYLIPYLIATLGDRLTEDKLGSIVDTLFAGLSGKDGGARGIDRLKLAGN